MDVKKVFFCCFVANIKVDADDVLIFCCCCYCV